MAPLGRRFCGDCGANLFEQLRERIGQATRDVEQATGLAEEHHYERAATLLRRHHQAGDYRFNEVAQRASAVLAKAEASQAHWEKKAEELREAAKAAETEQDYPRVVAALEKIPEPLRDDQDNERLRASRASHDRLGHWRRELKEALRQRDFVPAGLAIEQLLILDPSDEEYQRVAGKVAKALLESARKRLEQGRYARAIEYLDSIPSRLRDDKSQQMREQAEDALWMLRQLAYEPFAFPRLGRLAQRFAKMVPDDPRAPQVIQELVKAVKQPGPEPRQHIPKWKGKDASWLGRPVRILSLPQRLGFEKSSELRKTPGAYSVAIGLALQAVGAGRIKDPLHTVKKKGLKTIFQRRGASQAIGIDLGSTAVRAVHLQRDDQGTITVLQHWQVAFEKPLCRAGVNDEVSQLRHAGLRQIAEAIEKIDAPIWANLPGRDVLGRFLLLPPMKDRDVAPLLDREVEQAFPVQKNELKLVRWLQTEAEAQGGSRHGALVACRDRIAEQRCQLFQAAGIEPDALQCDPLALVNFAAWEFGDQWATAGDLPANGSKLARWPRSKKTDAQKTDAAKADAAKTEANQAEAAALSTAGNPSSTADRQRAVVLLDAGASATTFLVVTDNAFWFRSLDGGGEEITSYLTREAKLTAEQAEQGKRDPALLPSLAFHFQAIEERFAATAKKLEQSAADAQAFLPDHDVASLWTCGGASLMHGWIARVLVNREPTG